MLVGHHHPRSDRRHLPAVRTGRRSRRSGLAVSVGLVLVLIGALSKSAIVPMHFWLPGAMAAPTPVSAYLHAAAMVKAGVYLIARLTPGFADAPPWRPIVVVLGLADHAAGRLARGPRIRPQADPGVRHRQPAGPDHPAGRRRRRRPDAGRADHAVRARDVQGRAVHGRRRHRPRHRHPRHPPAGLARATRCPVLFVIAAAATASMAALPPFLGFVAKEADFETLLHSASLGPCGALRAGRRGDRVRCSPPSTACVSCGVRSRRKGLREPSTRVAELHRPPATFLVAPGDAGARGPGARPGARRARATCSTPTPTRCRGGSRLPPGALARVQPAAAVVGARAGGRHRGVHRRGNSCAADGSATCRWATPTGSTTPSLRGLDFVSFKVTGATQRGSMPATQSVDPGARWCCCRSRCWPSARATDPNLRLWDAPLQPVVGLLMLGGALGATVMRNRLAAVLLVGITGYGCGAIFAFHGAPDLALTQFLVETLTLVIFVLVLRTLPAEAEAAKMRRSGCRGRCWRVAVGATVTTLARVRDGGPHQHPDRRRCCPMPPTTAATAPTPSTCSWSTSAPGTPSARSRCCWWPRPGSRRWCSGNRRFGAAPRVPSAGVPAGQPDIGLISPTGYSPAVGDITWLRGSEFRDPRDRSLVLEVATRLIFPLIMVLSAVLLLHRAQHPRRRVRRRADRRAGAGAALPGGRPLRTRRDAAAGRRQDPRCRAGAVGRHRGRVAAPGRAGAVLGGDRAATFRCSGTSSSSPRCSSTSAST